MIFLNSASSAAALVFYLPCVCRHTDTEGKQRKFGVRNILKFSQKIQYLMNTLIPQSYTPRILLTHLHSATTTTVHCLSCNMVLAKTN